MTVTENVESYLLKLRLPAKRIARLKKAKNPGSIKFMRTLGLTNEEISGFTGLDIHTVEGLTSEGMRQERENYNRYAAKERALGICPMDDDYSWDNEC